MESNSVCNHTSDYKSDDRKVGVPFVNHNILSMITDRMDDMKSYYQLIITITISEKN